MALPLVTRGQAIIRHLATDKRFPGIGWATAKRLLTAFGETLYDRIRDRELKPLADVIGAERAVAIVDGFGMLCDEVEILRWLDRYGVAPRVAGAAARVWGIGAIDRIKADPYAMTLLKPWQDVDARALRLGVVLDDPRRLAAGVEQALAIKFRSGHMASPTPVVKQLVRRLLSSITGDPSRPIDVALANGRVVSPAADLLQGVQVHGGRGRTVDLGRVHRELPPLRWEAYPRRHRQGRAGDRLPSHRRPARGGVHGNVLRRLRHQRGRGNRQDDRRPGDPCCAGNVA
ncbi:hypothetical protein GOC54_32750 [Sinorhizobium meliloti]|nr:hypothetical protein [Sinorhizobium meliloti]